MKNKIVIVFILFWCFWLTYRVLFLEDVCIRYEQNIKLLSAAVLDLHGHK